MPAGRYAVAIAMTAALASTAAAGCSSSHTRDSGTGHDRSKAGAASTASPVTTTAAVRSLVLGECFTADRRTLTGGVVPPGSVRVLPCERPHLAEVFGRFTYAGRSLPAAGTLRQTAGIDCANLAPAYDMDRWTLPAATEPVHAFLPSRNDWAGGDHEGICYWASASGTPAVGTKRRDTTTLTSDQYAYLDAADRLESALEQTPPARGEATFFAYASWTGGVAESATVEAQLLTNHSWPAAARAPVHALIRRLGTVAALWRTASRTVTVPDLKNKIQAAEAVTPFSQDVAVRAVLGLATAHSR